MHARLHGSKSLLTLTKLYIESDFPSLADEIADPRPDMNTKVAAFTVSEKSIYTFQELSESVAQKCHRKVFQNSLYQIEKPIWTVEQDSQPPVLNQNKFSTEPLNHIKNNFKCCFDTNSEFTEMILMIHHYQIARLITNGH